MCLFVFSVAFTHRTFIFNVVCLAVSIGIFNMYRLFTLRDVCGKGMNVSRKQLTGIKKQKIVSGLSQHIVQLTYILMAIYKQTYIEAWFLWVNKRVNVELSVCGNSTFVKSFLVKSIDFF